MFSEMYCGLSVLVCMWLVQGVGQFWLQVGLQNNCVAIFSAFFFLVLLGVCNMF